jgi:hypothetical protein
VHEITHVIDARTVDNNYEKRLFRTEFITVDGSSLPLTTIYASKDRADRQTAELHSLFKSGRSSFEYYAEPLWWILYLAGVLALTNFLVLTALFNRSGLLNYLENSDISEGI